MPTITLPIRNAPHNTKPLPKTTLAKRNIVNDFAAYFGNESQLGNWQSLCNDVGLADNLPSIRQCRAVSPLAFFS